LQQESVPSLIERTVHTVRQHPECRDIGITTANMQPLEAFVDGPKLGRAVYNLLLNGCQSARTGTPPSIVSISVTDDEEKIRIAVTDSGKGVSPSIVDTLFQPFVSHGKVNGTGLGLTVAQHIAQEHGGEIRLERSTPGDTTFSILLYKKALHSLSQQVGGSSDPRSTTPDRSNQDQPIPYSKENR
jgi:signal transduction histidine kinase